MLNPTKLLITPELFLNGLLDGELDHSQISAADIKVLLEQLKSNADLPNLLLTHSLIHDVLNNNLPGMLNLQTLKTESKFAERFAVQLENEASFTPVATAINFFNPNFLSLVRARITQLKKSFPVPSLKLVTGFAYLAIFFVTFSLIYVRYEVASVPAPEVAKQTLVLNGDLNSSMPTTVGVVNNDPTADDIAPYLAAHKQFSPSADRSDAWLQLAAFDAQELR